MILNTRGVDYRCFVFNMNKNDPIKLLNNSALVIKEYYNEAFGGTYFSDIYSSVNDKFYKKLMESE